MKDSKKARDIHATAIKDFDRIQAALYNERKQCLEDRRFYSIAGAQWEGSLGDQFENKPKFEVNKVHLSLIKIFNEYRNNRITVDFITKDGKQEDKLADVCDGLFRADEQDSGAEEAYDNGFEEAVGGGFGAFRLTTEYEDEEDDEDERQRIRIEPIYDADTSVFFDLDAKRQDKADAKYCYVVYSTSPEQFEEEWGETPSSVPKSISDVEYDWFTPDVVYFAEYYKVEYEQQTIHVYGTFAGGEERYSDQDFEDDPDLEQRILEIGLQKLREKKTKRRRVRKYILSGSKILEDCGYIAGNNIPIVPVYGKRWFIDNVERCMGHVRLVKDAQRLKNMLTSKLAEISASSTVQKPIFTPEQVAGHEVSWSEDNIKNYPYLLINPITDAVGNPMPSGPIAYTQSAQLPPALATLMQVVDVDQHELLGGSGETDQMLSHVSGKAHAMIQKRIDGQSFIYMDNFAKAVRRAGEVWLSMAKDVYVEKGRRMKAVDPMGQLSQVTMGEAGNNVLTKASFDVTVDVGPSSSSQREATVQAFIGILATTQDPQTRQILESLIMLNMEGEGLSQTRAYFRKQLVQMGVLEPTQEEAEAMANATKEPSAQDKALEAMAQESMAKAQEAMAEAEKTRSEIIEILSKVDLNKAKVAQTYSDVDRQNLAQVKQMLEQMEAKKELEQQQQQAIMAQQQQLLQQQSGFSQTQIPNA